MVRIRTTSVLWVAIATLVAGLLVAGCGDSGGSSDTTAEPAQTTTAAPEPPESTTTAPEVDATTTTFQPETTTTLDPWCLEARDWGPMATIPGEYCTTTFGVPFAFTLPAGWVYSDDEGENGLGLAPANTDNKLFFHLPEGSIDEAVAFIEAMDRIEATAPEAITIGGAEGLQLRVRSLTDEDVDFGVFAFLGGSVSAVSILDVAGDTVIIQAMAPAGIIDTFEPKAIAIIESITWKTLQ